MSFLGTSFFVVILAVVLSSLFSWVEQHIKQLPTKGYGYAAPGWRSVADVFRNQLDGGFEKGGGITVYYQRELVVEFYGGYADPGSNWPWEKDTLTLAASTTKGLAALAVAILVDRGFIEYEKPVSHYWPEFGQNGKENITIDHVLSHQSALAAIDKEFSIFELVVNPENIGKLIEDQAPNWEVGKGHGYHGIMYGLILDQIVRRVDPHHRSMAEFVKDIIIRPTGIDFFVGLPKEENYRCARVFDFNILSLQTLKAGVYWPCIWSYLTDNTSLIARSVNNPPEYETMTNNPSFREIPSTSTHGYGTIDSLASLYSIIATGGTYGPNNKALISKEGIERMTETLSSGLDKVLLFNTTFARGFSVRKTPDGGEMYGNPGSGGQMAFFDLRHQLSWFKLTNHHSIFAFGDDPNYLQLEEAIYESVAKVSKQDTNKDD